MSRSARAVVIAAVVALAGLNIAQYAMRGEADAPPPAVSEPQGSVTPGSPEEKALITAFANHWVDAQQFYMRNRFLGIPALQNPLDAWIIQELLFEVKPDFVLETGTHHGGSAVLWAVLLEEVNPEGRVLTIDIEDLAAEARRLPIARRRVDFLLGSSTSPGIVAEVKRRVGDGRVLVILDSLHSYEHVLRELELYAPLVGPDSYIVVQDTGIWQPADGPRWSSRAVAEFVSRHPEWEIDRSRERFWLTNCPGSFLKRSRRPATTDDRAR